TVLGLAFDRCGRLYVLQTSSVAGCPTPFTGQVIRLDRRGHRGSVADSIFFPTAITFGPGGKLSTSNKGFVPPLPREILQLDVAGCGVAAAPCWCGALVRWRAADARSGGLARLPPWRRVCPGVIRGIPRAASTFQLSRF